MKAALRIAGTLVLLAAMGQAVRIGAADFYFHQDTAAAVERAATIWPNDANFETRLADLDEQRAIDHLRRAVALDPGLAKGWIQLGLRLELSGQVDEGERCYLEAARRDRQFLPAWTLANFYARRNDAEQFWPWARRAVEMSYDDIAPLLRLAFGFTDDPQLVQKKIIVPNRKVEHFFLYYLINEKIDATPIAARLLASAGKDDSQPLLAWNDRLIATARIADARDLWNALSDRHLIDYPHAGSITNPDFARESIERGFDWHFNKVDGVSATRSSGALRIEFSGSQPETCELASQYLAVTAGKYRLTYEYRTTGIPKTTSLHWWVGDASSDPIAASEDWHRGSWTFTGNKLNRLILLEQRESGATRPEGTVYLRHLGLTSTENQND